MGKVSETIKLTSVFDNTKCKELDAVIDTGATANPLSAEAPMVGMP